MKRGNANTYGESIYDGNGLEYYYESINGTELKAFMDYKYLDDKNEKQKVVIQLGTISAIGWVVQQRTKIKTGLGHKNPTAVAKGNIAISGQLVFEQIDISSFKELKKALLELNAPVKDLKEFTDLPPFDIKILAINETEPSEKAGMELYNVEIATKTQSLGIDEIAIKEVYGFVATEMSNLGKI